MNLGSALPGLRPLDLWSPIGLDEPQQSLVDVTFDDGEQQRDVTRNQVVLSLAPLVASGVRSVLPEAKLDVGAIPNAAEVNRHLFPNVSVTSDDGKVLRMETRASLALPVDIAGLDAFVLGAFVVGAAFGG